MVSPRVLSISGGRRRNIRQEEILDDGRTGLYFCEPGHHRPSFSFLPPLFLLSSVVGGATKLYCRVRAASIADTYG
jgi:hypothetical protein